MSTWWSDAPAHYRDGARPEQVFAAPAQEAAEVAVVAALAAAPIALST